MEAVEVAGRHRLELLHALACLQVAGCQLLLGCTQRALRLTRHCLGFLLSHAGKADRCRAWLLAAKCRVADASRLPEWERRAELLEGVRQVGIAKDGFSEVGCVTFLQCFGSGSGSVLDPYSIGPLDPDPDP
jgi:hypothetical protein